MKDRRYTIEIVVEEGVNKYRACAALLAEAIVSCAHYAPDVPLNFKCCSMKFGLLTMTDPEYVEESDEWLPPPPF